MTLLSSSEAAWRRSKVTLAVQHDVLRLQVSVDDALLVQVAQSHGDLRQVKTTHNTQHTWKETSSTHRHYVSSFYRPNIHRQPPETVASKYK